MAVVRWNFPNGSHNDSLTAALAGADTSNFTGGTAILSSDQFLSGVSTLSARFTTTLGGHFWVAREGLSATQYAYDIYVYISTRVGGTVYLAWAGASSSARSLGVIINGQNKISLNDSTATAAWEGAPEVLPDNTWVRISVWGNCTTGEAQCAWYLGHSTTPVESSGLLTGLSIQSGIDRIRWGGKAASSSVVAGDIYFGSWAYDTTASGLLAPADTSGPIELPMSLGAAAIADARVGDQAVTKLYIGDTNIWSSS